MSEEVGIPMEMLITGGESRVTREESIVITMNMVDGGGRVYMDVPGQRGFETIVQEREGPHHKGIVTDHC